MEDKIKELIDKWKFKKSEAESTSVGKYEYYESGYNVATVELSEDIISDLAQLLTNKEKE